MLAATEKPYYPIEIEERFQKVLFELDWNKATKKESLLSYAKEIAQKIVSEELSPDDGCKRIYNIYKELEYTEYLNDWLWLDEGYDPEINECLYDEYGHYPLNKKQEWFDAIISAAKRLVETNFS